VKWTVRQLISNGVNSDTRAPKEKQGDRLET